MNSEKYKLIRVDERHHNGESGLDLPTYRIMATRTIHLIDGKVVQPGELGGFVDNERCLSHDGNCWIADDARAYGNTVVRNDALAKGNCVLGDPLSSKRGATLSGKAMVSQYATVVDSSVEDEARVDEHAQVRAGSIIRRRSRVGGFAHVSFSTVNDDSCVSGAAKLFDTGVWDRAFVMGEAELSKCNVRNRSVVKGFVRAENVNIVGNSFLQGFASAIAETGTPARCGHVVEGKFSGTADALAPKEDVGPLHYRQGQTLFMGPEAFRGSVHGFLEREESIIDESIFSTASSPAPDSGFDVDTLGHDRGTATATTRECGAKTASGAPCTHRVGLDASECRAGHEVAGRS